MAAPTTTSDLRNLLERSGLLPSHLIDPAFTTGDRDPDAIARRLVDEGLLTPFQARQLQRGRADGFFLTDKYKILDFIGSGGMGKVYLCEHLILHRLVAVKLLQLPPVPTADAARNFERFYREARAVARLDDPNIIRVFDVDRVGPNPFMVMEYADGTNLHDVVARHGPLPCDRACHYIRQGALGLQHAHEAGLIHRDVKPGNLILDRWGTVKVLDLGLARFADPDRNQAITDKYDKNLVIGTADFMAPEQAFDSTAVDIRSDVYGLGCTFYFLLTGRVPFPDRSVPEKMYSHKTRAPAPVSELCPHVPAGVLGILERMMAKEQAERFQTPAEVVEALAARTVEPIPPPPDKEMPEHPAAFYRLGLSPAPGPGSALAVTPNPSSSAETLPARLGEWDVAGYDDAGPAASPRPKTQPTADPQSGAGAPAGRPLGERRRAVLRRRWLVRGVELVVFAAAAGLVAWLVSRRDRGPEVTHQPGPPTAVRRHHSQRRRVHVRASGRAAVGDRV
jgi:eukaryotic-like serine/threonine-protein kinase